MRRRWAVFASRRASTIVNGRDRAADVIQLSERSLNCAAHQVSRYANCEHDCKQSHKEAVGKPRRRISSWTCRIRTQHLLTLFNLKDSDHLAWARFFRTTRFKQDALIALILRWHEASRYEE